MITLGVALILSATINIHLAQKIKYFKSWNYRQSVFQAMAKDSLRQAREREPWERKPWKCEEEEQAEHGQSRTI